MTAKTRPNKTYEVIIVGGGITGSALLYTLAHYTNIRRLALLEKYQEPAMVNSHPNNNSQTLHFGDIETNYTLEKAKKVKEAAQMLARYLEAHAPEAFIKKHKMVLAVGAAEVQTLEKRYQEFRSLFPNLKKIGPAEIAKLEPMVIKGRRPGQKILALLSQDGYTVDYKALAESFIKKAQDQTKQKTVQVFFKTQVQSIKKKKDGYTLKTSQGTFQAKVVAVTAGPHSLIFARSLGYGQNFGILPVAGSFYRAPKLLNGKVYTLQIKKLPFAAIHGDPDVKNPSETRFGPTAKVLPLLERHNYRTIVDFLKTSVWNLRGVFSLLTIISDPTILKYVLKNLAYDLPIIGKWLFLKNVRKIVPTAKYRDLKYGKGLGGIRPQVVNVQTKKLELGEAEIVGDRILFNITPSPGASVALKNAEQEALKIIKMLGPPFRFDQKRWAQEFGSTFAPCQE